MNVEMTIGLAQVSLKNGQATEMEQEKAIRSAQAADVSTFDYIRGRLFLQTSGGNQELAQLWLSESETECGNFCDHLEAYTVSLHQIKSGQVEQGAGDMKRLRQRIAKSGNPKSARCLLPAIETTLADIG